MRLIDRISQLMNNQMNIRNVALVAHIDHGKTTLSDSLLASAGILAPSTAGEARALDFLPEEQRRGITMKTANISLVFERGTEEYLVNLIDSPGHVDFSGKVARALRIADGAIVVIDAVEQIMAQTETVIRQCTSEGVKPILFINKVDRLIKELRLTPKQIAERIEILYNNFNSLVAKFSARANVPKWKSTTRDGSVIFGSALHRWAISIPVAKETKITFDKIVELYEKNEQEQLQELIPIEKPLIDMIINHLPNPIEAQRYRISNIWSGDNSSEIGKAMVNCQSKEGESPLVFASTKILSDPHAGTLLLGRVFSGVLTEKMNVLLVNQKAKTKIQNVYVFMGADKKRIQQVPAGNIVALSGLGELYPGETIVSDELTEFVPFEQIRYLATPVVTIAIEPKMLRNLPSLKHVLERYEREDPNLIVTVDEKSGEILLMGLGELHLETIVNDVSSEVECTASPPLVIIVEKIEKPSKIEAFESFDSKVILQVLPNNHSKDEQKIIDEMGENRLQITLRQYFNEIILSKKIIEKLSNESIENVIMGAKDALTTGPIAGKPVFGIKILIHDFIAQGGEKFEHTIPLIRNAIWNALRKGKITTQEPIYRIQITTPTIYLGKITSTINKRRGNITDVRTDQDLLIITGYLPVAESFKIDRDLRSDTEGRAFWQMSFERYEPVKLNEHEKL